MAASAVEAAVHEEHGARGYWKPCLALFGAGLIGVVSLYPALRPTAEALLERPDAPDLPFWLSKRCS